MRTIIGMALIFVFGFSISGDAGTNPPKKNTNPPKPPDIIYQVIEIHDVTSVVTFQVIENKQVPSKRNELNKQFQDAMNEWGAERNTFNKTYPDFKFVKPSPVMPVVTVLGAEEKVKSKADAEARSRQNIYDRTHYQVVQIQDATGAISFQVVECAKFNAKCNEIFQQFMGALKLWVDARDAFVKANPTQKYDKPCPYTPVWAVLMTGEKDKAEAALISYRDTYNRDHPDTNGTPKKSPNARN